ncbi:MAG: alkaline phosphatase [Candidatus Ancaeobacter aquaticus]|nr:alkaline phosphatase [Candidatus Ancaeobacter aquaticus]
MKRIMVVGVFISLCLAIVAAPSHQKACAEETTKAKNIILVMPDGMGFGSLSLLIDYSYLYKKKPLSINTVMEKGNTGYCVTSLLKYVVPEGCAGVTGVATGEKTTPVRLSVSPNGERLQTIVEYAKERGMKTGVVTTGRVSHYASSAFLAHAKNRKVENEIAEQETLSGVDVLLGGGLRHWIPQGKKVSDIATISKKLGADTLSKREDDKNLIDQVKEKGYEVVFTAEDMASARGDKLIGLFSASALPFSIDGRSQEGLSSPSLSQMTKKAIEVLKQDDAGFLLIVSDGLLSQLLHENDPAGTLAQLVEVDNAVKEAVDFARTNPDTLILVASPRDVGGVAFSAHEDKSLLIENDFGIPNDFAKLELQKKSSNALFKDMGKEPSSAKIKKVISESTAYDLSGEEAMWVRVFPADEFFPKYMGYPYGALGKILGKKTGIVWVSQYNTALMTPIFGMGPGSQRVKGIKTTTDIFHIMKDAIK